MQRPRATGPAGRHTVRTPGRPQALRHSILVGLSATALLGAPAFAADGQKLSLTVYNSDLALVQDIRTLDVAAGRQRLEFKASPPASGPRPW